MNLRQTYTEQIVPTLTKEFGIKNIMAVPKVTKIVLNIGLKEAAHDKGVLDKTVAWFEAIAGQKVKVTNAKTSIANFKLRENDPVGITVTLRGTRMYDFMTKLFTIVLPRIRDFQGVSKTSFDAQGNYTLGMPEQIVFPEVDYAKIDKVRGLEITFVNFTPNKIQAFRLLELLGMPFKKA